MGHKIIMCCHGYYHLQDELRYNAKKGCTLLAKVRDIIASCMDSRAGCKFYAILAHYTD